MAQHLFLAGRYAAYVDKTMAKGRWHVAYTHLKVGCYASKLKSLRAGFTDPLKQGALEPTSPRSVLACLRLGIEPAELLHVPLDNYLRKGEAIDLAHLAYDHCEGIRQVWVTSFADIRKLIFLRPVASSPALLVLVLFNAGLGAIFQWEIQHSLER